MGVRLLPYFWACSAFAFGTWANLRDRDWRGDEEGCEEATDEAEEAEDAFANERLEADDEGVVR